MIRFPAILVLVILLGPILGSAADNKACGLATATELESALGGKVGALHGSSMPGSDAQICSGATPQAQVMLRLARRKEGSEGKEAKGVQIAKQMGAQVDVKTFGPVTCSTFIPPENMQARAGFNTTCTMKKGDMVAGIEITTRSRAAMVPIDKLRPIAEKMPSRF
jgi:hypothetical protein